MRLSFDIAIERSHQSTLVLCFVMKLCLIISIFCALVAKSSATSSWIEYRQGTVNIILSVPHGGNEKPSNITDRIDGCKDANDNCVYNKNSTCATNDCDARTSIDSYTKSIANSVYDDLCDLLGNNDKPYFVFNKLHRSKLDVNREVDLGAQGDAQAILAYDTYHDYIIEAKNESGPRGIIFDFHGQSHPPNYMELGYLITKTDLNNEDYDTSSSSIKALVAACNVTGEDILVGPLSFGELLQDEGKDAVPSETNPKPTPGESFYSGGHITKIHGSRDGGQYDAIQLEMPNEERLSAYTNSAGRAAYAEKIANAIYNYYQEFYLSTSC